MENKNKSEKKICIEDLPVEILLKTFAYLDIDDLYSCARVSKRIRHISLDDSLWTQSYNLCLNQNIPTSFIEEILNNGCKYLSLNNAKIEGKINLQKKCQLKYLDLACCSIYVKYDGDLTVDILKQLETRRLMEDEVLEKIVGSCHSLQKLSLHYLCIASRTRTNLVKTLSLQNGRTLQVFRFLYPRFYYFEMSYEL